MNIHSPFGNCNFLKDAARDPGPWPTLRPPADEPRTLHPAPRTLHPEP